MRTAAGCMEAVEEDRLHLSFTEVKAAMGNCIMVLYCKKYLLAHVSVVGPVSLKTTRGSATSKPTPGHALDDSASASFLHAFHCSHQEILEGGFQPLHLVMF